LAGEERIELGSRVVIGPHSWLQVVQAARGTTPVISIGDGTSTAGYLTITAAKQVIIEPNVLIARYVYISDHSHAFASHDAPIQSQGIAGVAPVRICAGAWLGQSVVICPGVTVGRNSVIGANSVVRHDVPDFCVAAGVPARVIRRIEHAGDARLP
jgi:acetyltransferase-like isoleucine patch superfamily enzyme